MKRIFRLESLFCFWLLYIIFVHSKILFASSDFYTALKNYESGNYRLAQVFFENFINENPRDTLIPDANYYLLKIYDKKEDFLKFFTFCNTYLDSFKFHQKREEIFNLLIQKLITRKNYSLAFDYIKKYDYLHIDSNLLSEIVLNLGSQGYPLDELLRFAPDNDSLMILKALRKNNLDDRIKIFQNINGVKGKIYLIEHYLMKGDTIQGYLEYQKIAVDDISEDYLYHWAKFSIDFNLNDLFKIIKRMSGKEKLKEEIKILSIFTEHNLPESLSIKNKTDFQIIQKFLNMRHISSEQLSKPPVIDSFLTDTLDIENNISLLRKEYKKNFYLDSLYCEILLKKGKFEESYDIINEYLKFSETRNFARIIRALKLYNEKNYRDALKDLMLASFDNQYLKFIYSECLEYNNFNPEPIYEELSKTANDSLIKFKSFSNFIRYEFQQKKYSVIAKFKPDLFLIDTSLTRYYFLSLIYTDKKSIVESLYIKTFGTLDKEFYYAYLQNLMENNNLTKAQNLIDSLICLPEFTVDDTFNYYAGFIPFRKGDYKLAEARFTEFIKKFKNGRYYYSALFKIGTIKYLNQEFDSSAHYYNLAAFDSELKFDALKNQIIALKKAERWNDLIEIGKKIIEICPDSLKAEYYFETGYAYLRKGDGKSAIEYLKMATALKPSVDYYYWLGEAYMGKGDFMHALYHYQKIVSDFKKDKMWYPTALFKVGLALEMLDEIKEARSIYKRIINEFGSGDVWGAEARKRL
ncbi:MAG: tetratricopeptide repeat protein, partial [candidate division WOR-3 bacterium]